MKKSFILLVVVSACFLTGCDFFRSLAGRPTSEDIEKQREEIKHDVEIKRAELLAIQQEEELMQKRLDSLKIKEMQVRDSLAALDSIKRYGGTILNPAELGGLFATKLESRYHIIVGSFKQRKNAEALLLKVQKKGYEPALISFNNGLIAVGLCPSGTIVDVMESLKKVKKEKFCPKDVWVLLNE